VNNFKIQKNQVKQSEGYNKFKQGLKNKVREELSKQGPKNVNADVTVKAPK